MIEYHNYYAKEFHQALIDYVDARYKPIKFEKENMKDDWYCDSAELKNWKAETAWNLENNEAIETGELHQFIQDLINTFLMKDNKKIWVLDENA